MQQSVFFQQFLVISDIKTLIFLVILAALFFMMRALAAKKASFAKRVLLSTGIGLILGIVMQLVAGFPDNPGEVIFIKEATGWFGLIGGGFIDLVRMLVVPLVMVSIIKVIIDMDEGMQINKMVRNTIIITMAMVAIAVMIGLALGMLFGVGAAQAAHEGTAQAKAITPLYTTLRKLLPNNPVQAMIELNVIAIVIFAAFIGFGAKRMSKKYMDVVKPFCDLIHALHKIIMSIAMTIVKLMPYAVIPLLASTIATRGMNAILEVGKFIVVLYLGMAIMFVIQLLALVVFKINPIFYLRKSLHVMLLAFTSRSSVGCLPVTIDNLTNRLGVNSGTASFVASFGSTAGMQGCAGVFPALLIVFVSNMAGTPIDITLIVMSVIVISIGSLGIAGIPGTATMAASMALSGTGMSSLFNLISPIVAIDPLIDMGRTMLNVTGAMTNALMVDQSLGQLDHKAYANMNVAEGMNLDE